MGMVLKRRQFKYSFLEWWGTTIFWGGNHFIFMHLINYLTQVFNKIISNWVIIVNITVFQYGVNGKYKHATRNAKATPPVFITHRVSRVLSLSLATHYWSLWDWSLLKNPKYLGTIFIEESGFIIFTLSHCWVHICGLPFMGPRAINLKRDR